MNIRESEHGMTFGHTSLLACFSGMLKIHSGASGSQQTVLTIPANQLKQLSVGSGSGLQTIFMPVGKGKTFYIDFLIKKLFKKKNNLFLVTIEFSLQMETKKYIPYVEKRSE